MNEPRTVRELQQRCDEMGLQLYHLHVVIGQDVNMPKIFGIYQDPETDEFVVYKNKADGSRAVRYRGPDEAYAVGKIWAKLQELVDLSTPTRPLPSPEPLKDDSHGGVYEGPPEGFRLPCKTYPSDGAQYHGDYDEEMSADMDENASYEDAYHAYARFGDSHGVHAAERPARRVRRRHRDLFPGIMAAMVVLVILVGFVLPVALLLTNGNTFHDGRGPSYRKGYYDVGGEHYYYNPGAGWFVYDTLLDDWSAYEMPAQDRGYYNDYYIDDYGYYDDSYGFEDWYADEYASGYDWTPTWTWTWDSGDKEQDYDYDDSYYDDDSSVSWGWSSDDDSSSSWDWSWGDDDDWGSSSYDYSWDNDYDWDSDW